MVMKAERKRAVTPWVNLDRVFETSIPALIKAMEQAIEPQCEFTPMDWREAERLLQVCALAVWDDSFDPAHAKEMVRDFRSGYGWWLQWVEKGLRIALDTVPDRDHLHHQLWGSFRMVKALLYEVDISAPRRVKDWAYPREWEEEYLEKQFANS
jgi:hypothetical protein